MYMRFPVDVHYYVRKSPSVQAKIIRIPWVHGEITDGSDPKKPIKIVFYRLNPLKFHDIIIFDGFFHDIPWIFHQETIKKAMENPSLGVHLSPRPAAATEWWQFTFAQRGVRGAFAADARAPVGTM